MQDNPLISILVPCYNAGNFLSECLDAALAQKYPNTEILAFDDGSKDNTWDVLERYSGKVKSFRAPLNTGASRARNFLLYESKGAYIHFQDADDLMLPDFLDIMSGQIMASGLEAVLCNVDDFINNDPSNIIGSWRVRERSIDEDWLLYMIRIGGQAINSLYKREALLKIRGFRDTIAFTEDYDLHLRLAEAGARFTVIERALIKKRRKPQEMYINLENKTMAACYNTLADLYKRLEMSSVETPSQIYKEIAEHLWYVGRFITDLGTPEEGIACLRLSKKVSRLRQVPESFLYQMLNYFFGVAASERCRFHWHKIKKVLKLKNK